MLQLPLLLAVWVAGMKLMWLTPVAVPGLEKLMATWFKDGLPGGGVAWLGGLEGAGLSVKAVALPDARTKT